MAVKWQGGLTVTRRPGRGRRTYRGSTCSPIRRGLDRCVARRGGRIEASRATRAPAWANEHTGAAMIAMLAAMLWWLRRRGERWTAWMVTGLIGLAAGYLALLLAPGQRFRYTGMAAHQSILDRVLARDLSDTLRWLGFAVAAAALVLPWVVAGRLVRSRRDPRPPVAATERLAVWLFALGGVATIAALLGSPKQGWRLVYAPSTLWIVAAAIWLRPRLAGRARRALIALALAGLAAQSIQLHGPRRLVTARPDRRTRDHARLDRPLDRTRRRCLPDHRRPSRQAPRRGVRRRRVLSRRHLLALSRGDSTPRRLSWAFVTVRPPSATCGAAYLAGSRARSALRHHSLHDPT